MSKYSATILADSIGPHNGRLTTLEVTFPRFILPEFNTHRMLSRNSASSRAIPTEKMLERAIREPFIPEFNRRVKGMGVGEPLSDSENRRYKRKWLQARDAAVEQAEAFLRVDKSRANRLLEPFLWHTVIVTATEWDNFFNLRCHPDAQPEFRRIAEDMRTAMALSEPARLEFSMWHLPLVDRSRDLHHDASHGGSLAYWEQRLAETSAGRCARVSYDKHDQTEDAPTSIHRWERLSTSGHWSPGEHPARCEEPIGGNLWYGNFKGWKQLRKFYEGEAVFQG